MALERVDWPRDDRRWFNILEQPLRIWNHGSGHWANPEWDRGTYLECFRLVLDRCDPNIRGREQDDGEFGLTILHSVAGSREHVTAEERVAFATMLLDAGARIDARDNLLKSTPLGWACRWGQIELVELFLERGADPVEPDAEPWATPKAWAQRMGHDRALALLAERSG
jgi:ankyrin repeat protein